MTIKPLLTALCFVLWVQASVRRSTVYAASRIFSALSEQLLFTHLGHELPDVIEWLIDAQRSDPDTETRQLAAHCLLALKQLLGENPFLGQSLRSVPSAAASAASSLQRPSSAVPLLTSAITKPSLRVL